MSDQSLFNNQETPNTADQPQTLFTIGDRNYDAESARTKIENADNFINTLKGEKDDIASQLAVLQQQNAQLAAQVEQSTKLEEALTMFQHQNNEPQAQADATPSLDVEALTAKLEADIMAKIQASEAAKAQSANFGKSMEAAQKAFGADVATKLQERGAQLGMDVSAIDQLAKTQPAVFNELFIPKTSGQQATPDNNLNTNVHSQANLDAVMDDWSDKGKFWSSQSKAQSLRQMTDEVTKLIKEGKIDPNSKNFF